MEEFEQTCSVDGMLFQVHFTWYPFHAGKRGDFGLQIEPDDPETCEIDEVYMESDGATHEVQHMLSAYALEHMLEQLTNPNK